MELGGLLLRLLLGRPLAVGQRGGVAVRCGEIASVALHLLVLGVVVVAMFVPGVVVATVRVAQSSFALMSTWPIWDHVLVEYCVGSRVAIVA